MLVGEWICDDGYWEATISLSTLASPCLKARAVFKSDGTSIPVVRDYHNGYALSAKCIGSRDLERTKKRAIDLAREFIEKSLRPE